MEKIFVTKYWHLHLHYDSPVRLEQQVRESGSMHANENVAVVCISQLVTERIFSVDTKNIKHMKDTHSKYHLLIGNQQSSWKN